MKFAYNLVEGLIVNLFVFIKEWTIITLNSGLSPELATIIFIIICTSLFFASGFISATISELKGRNRFIHFLAGLAAPYLYPALIYFLLPKYVPKSPAEQLFGDELAAGHKSLSLRRQGRQREASSSEEKYPDGGDISDVEINVPKAMNALYFNALISRPDEIRNRENYIFTLKDGSTLSAIRIMEAAQTLLVIEVMDVKKKMTKTIRLPYDRIEDCEIIPVEEDEAIAMKESEEMLDPLINDETRFIDVTESDLTDTADADTTVTLSKADLTQTLYKLESEASEKDSLTSIHHLAQDEVEQNEVPKQMDRHYFATIAVDDAGNQRGPFIMEMLDGRILEVIRIVEPMDNLVVVETLGKEGKKRTIRIPYSKIMRCTDKDKWV